MMTVNTKVDFQDYSKLMFTLSYRKPIMILLTLAGITMLITSLLYFAGVDIPFDEPPFFQLVFGFAIVFLLPFSIYRTSKKNFYSHSKLQERMIYEFTDEKVLINGESFNSEFDWKSVFKISELNDWILIYQSNQIANLLPKKAFGEDLEAFKTLVKGKNIKSTIK